MENQQLYERYQRQMLLKELGEAGQQKLLKAKVLVIGAGGLGCPVLQYLAAAGVGTIGIVDDDVVSLTNLHRQVLYTTSNIGYPKVERALIALKNLNPDIDIVSYNYRLTNLNALEIIAGYDIVADCTDNFSSRYMINDACVLLDKPLVYAAISRFEGQVAVFNYSSQNSKGVNYRDLFPDPPADDEILNCAEAGVIGVLPAIIGSMQAAEVIKLITGIGKPLVDRLLTYNALNNNILDLTLSASNVLNQGIPRDEHDFRRMDYNFTCQLNNNFEIEPEQFSEFIHQNDVTVVDVRELDELPSINQFHHLHIPLKELKNQVPVITNNTIIAFCQSGKRSIEAANILFNTFGKDKKVYSLKGGITTWLNYQNKS